MPIHPNIEIHGVNLMSTRAEILIQGSNGYNYDYKLYHHTDGYPEYLGKFLMDKIHPLLMKSNNYKTCDIANALLKDEEDKDFELTSGLHPDIEYQYIINIPKKTITGYKCHYERDYIKDEYELVICAECDLQRYLPISNKKRYSWKQQK